LLEEKGFTNLTASELKTFSARLSYLVSIGCKPYELVVYPKILLLDKSEIDNRVEKLRLASSVSGISVSLLRYANPKKYNSTVKVWVKTHLKALGGYMNKVDEIIQELRCSDAKAMEILTRNPRLIGEKYRKDMANKIRCLIGHGARHEDLHRNTNILNNNSLATIQSRAERLSKLGWIPLPLGIIGHKDFETVVARWEAQSQLCKDAGVDNVIRLLLPMSANQIKVIRPKIQFLLSEGYAASEILGCPAPTLRLSLKKLRGAVAALRPYHLQCVDLATINHYARTRRVLSTRRCDFRAVVARAVGCPRTALPPLPKHRDIRAVRDLERASDANVRFLRDELGFAADDLASVPLVVAHAPDVVRRHWNALSDDDDARLSCVDWRARELFRRSSGNARLRLNVLQYCVEKEANFSHACVSSWTEHSDDEFDATGLSSPPAGADPNDDDDEVNYHDDGDDECAGPHADRFRIVDDRGDDDVDHPLMA